jgi:hypothetical protein
MMAKKLFEKAGLIQHPQPGAAERRLEVPKPEVKAKTAPGAMMHFLASQSDAMKEAEALKFGANSVLVSSDPAAMKAHARSLAL